MRLPPRRRFLVIALAVLALASACSSQEATDDSALGSATVVEEQTTTTVDVTTTGQVETSTTQPTTSSTTARVGSAEANEFKQLAPTVAGIGDGVVAFTSGLQAARIDDLAAEACATISPGMNDEELGVKGLAAYDGLPAEEQAAIAVDDWVVFYGGMIGFFCPDQLPEVDLEATPVDGTEVERFRAIVTEVSGVSAETELFVSTLTDERLDELQIMACAESSSSLTTEEFGIEIVQSYDRDLDAAEISGIGLSAYSEFYGALVGWFCPGRLPR